MIVAKEGYYQLPFHFEIGCQKYDGKPNFS